MTMSKTSGKTSTHASILDRINPIIANRIEAAAMAWINAGGSADSFWYYRSEIEQRIREINAGGDAWKGGVNAFRRVER